MMEAPQENLVVVTDEEEIQCLFDKAVEATLPQLFEKLSSAGREPPKEWLSNREAMEYLDLSKSTLQRYRDDGTLPYSKLGGNIFYRRDDLLHVLQQNRNGEISANSRAS